ncbi:hypothetical protein MASSI9I_50026 [Massilia sp. 9I]|nr:hypothetical protein MASSI9I_50026 [Massilia sp. 9I]
MAGSFSSFAALRQHKAAIIPFCQDALFAAAAAIDTTESEWTARANSCGCYGTRNR